MRISLLYFVIISIFFISCNQEDEKDKSDLPENMYWFKIDVDVEKNVDYGTFKYSVKNVSYDISEGNIEDYTKSQITEINKEKIIIGPFFTKEAAEESVLFYKSADSNNLDSLSSYDKSIYWYAVHFEKPKNKNGWLIKRTPVSVIETPIGTFGKYFAEGLSMEIFPIGPFRDKKAAEYSKKTNIELGIE